MRLAKPLAAALCTWLCLLGQAGTLHAQTLNEWVAANCGDCEARMASQTGAYILEKGEEALVGRAWALLLAGSIWNEYLFAPPRFPADPTASRNGP